MINIDKQVNDFLQKYNELNNSFSKSLVFGVGLEAGFYSEFNNMALAILYCLENKIKLYLHSSKSNFGKWTDFFEPFCIEKNNCYTDKFDHRFSAKNLTNKQKIREKIVKIIGKIYGINYLTYDLFETIHNLEEKYYNIEKLNISGTTQQICGEIIRNIYRFNSQTINAIEQLTNKIAFEQPYIGFHIRGGDKIIEHEIMAIDSYVQKAEQLTEIRNAFIFTDDYIMFETFQKKHPQWNIKTLTNSSETGYFHNEFQQQNALQKRNELIKMFASIEILRNAQQIFCTYSSNIGMFLGMIEDNTIQYNTIQYNTIQYNTIPKLSVLIWKNGIFGKKSTQFI
ncbi:MAG: hypothetical protein LBS50_08450 [Prevotellaceae bacterium]|jgi:hypothetical protein|nr:hypothetical protein [Prevotellaceae bacterium]